MIIPTIAQWGKKKGIDLLATGDWTHPLWFRELQTQLEEVSDGIFRSTQYPDGAKFLLSSEVSSIYSQAGRVRRVHTLIFAPSLSIVERINRALNKRGCNLSADGRPIIGLSCRELAEIVYSIDQTCLIIPAHAWTPWFSVFGSKGGFDSIAECFGEFADRIVAIETGLSSDPAMNWKIKELENRAVVSFSDAHSPMKLGREATVFSFKQQVTSNPSASLRASKLEDFTYDDIYGAIAQRFTGVNEGRLKIGYTIEFYPQEGKYHYTGHRGCGVIHSPDQTRNVGTMCPVCGKGLTVGVMHRVDELSGTSEAIAVKRTTDAQGVTFVHHPRDQSRPAYVMLVPLSEILAQVHGVSPSAKTVLEEYQRLTSLIGGEFHILLSTPLEDLRKVGGARLAEAIQKVRSQDIFVDPGYDGVFGTVTIWKQSDEQRASKEQMSLFS